MSVWITPAIIQEPGTRLQGRKDTIQTILHRCVSCCTHHNLQAWIPSNNTHPKYLSTGSCDVNQGRERAGGKEPSPPGPDWTGPWIHPRIAKICGLQKRIRIDPRRPRLAAPGSRPADARQMRGQEVLWTPSSLNSRSILVAITSQAHAPSPSSSPVTFYHGLIRCGDATHSFLIFSCLPTVRGTALDEDQHRCSSSGRRPSLPLHAAHRPPHVGSPPLRQTRGALTNKRSTVGHV